MNTKKLFDNPLVDATLSFCFASGAASYYYIDNEKAAVVNGLLAATFALKAAIKVRSSRGAQNTPNTVSIENSVD